MANTASAKKAVRKIERRTEVNKDRRSRMRTFVRKVEEAIAQPEQGAAAVAFFDPSQPVAKPLWRDAMADALRV